MGNNLSCPPSRTDRLKDLYTELEGQTAICRETRAWSEMVGLLKGRATLLRTWSGPESSRKLRFPDFMTTAQDVGNVVSLTHRPTLPQEIELVLSSVRG